MEGAAGLGFEYGRLEIFRGGRWGNVCQGGTFTPDSAQVACRQLGYDGGARLDWLLPYSFGLERSLVRARPAGSPAAVSHNCAVSCMPAGTCGEWQMWCLSFASLLRSAFTHLV